jgi:hypothetical protein
VGSTYRALRRCLQLRLAPRFILHLLLDGPVALLLVGVRLARCAVHVVRVARAAASGGRPACAVLAHTDALTAAGANPAHLAGRSSRGVRRSALETWLERIAPDATPRARSRSSRSLASSLSISEMAFAFLRTAARSQHEQGAQRGARSCEPSPAMSTLSALWYLYLPARESVSE